MFAELLVDAVSLQRVLCGPPALCPSSPACSELLAEGGPFSRLCASLASLRPPADVLVLRPHVIAVYNASRVLGAPGLPLRHAACALLEALAAAGGGGAEATVEVVRAWARVGAAWAAADGGGGGGDGGGALCARASDAFTRVLRAQAAAGGMGALAVALRGAECEAHAQCVWDARVALADAAWGEAAAGGLRGSRRGGAPAEVAAGALLLEGAGEVLRHLPHEAAAHGARLGAMGRAYLHAQLFEDAAKWLGAGLEAATGGGGGGGGGGAHAPLVRGLLLSLAAAEVEAMWAAGGGEGACWGARGSGLAAGELSAGAARARAHVAAALAGADAGGGDAATAAFIAMRLAALEGRPSEAAAAFGGVVAAAARAPGEEGLFALCAQGARALAAGAGWAGAAALAGYDAAAGADWPAGGTQRAALRADALAALGAFVACGAGSAAAPAAHAAFRGLAREVGEGHAGGAGAAPLPPAAAREASALLRGVAAGAWEVGDDAAAEWAACALLALEGGGPCGAEAAAGGAVAALRGRRFPRAFALAAEARRRADGGDARALLFRCLAAAPFPDTEEDGGPGVGAPPPPAEEEEAAALLAEGALSPTHRGRAAQLRAALSLLAEDAVSGGGGDGGDCDEPRLLVALSQLSDGDGGAGARADVAAVALEALLSRAWGGGGGGGVAGKGGGWCAPPGVGGAPQPPRPHPRLLPLLRALLASRDRGSASGAPPAPSPVPLLLRAAAAVRDAGPGGWPALGGEGDIAWLLGTLWEASLEGVGGGAAAEARAAAEAALRLLRAMRGFLRGGAASDAAFEAAAELVAAWAGAELGGALPWAPQPPRGGDAGGALTAAAAALARAEHALDATAVVAQVAALTGGVGAGPAARGGGDLWPSLASGAAEVGTALLALAAPAPAGAQPQPLPLPGGGALLCAAFLRVLICARLDDESSGECGGAPERLLRRLAAAPGCAPSLLLEAGVALAGAAGGAARAAAAAAFSMAWDAAGGEAAAPPAFAAALLVRAATALDRVAALPLLRRAAAARAPAAPGFGLAEGDWLAVHAYNAGVFYHRLGQFRRALEFMEVSAALAAALGDAVACGGGADACAALAARAACAAALEGARREAAAEAAAAAAARGAGAFAVFGGALPQPPEPAQPPPPPLPPVAVPPPGAASGGAGGGAGDATGAPKKRRKAGGGEAGGDGGGGGAPPVKTEPRAGGRGGLDALALASAAMDWTEVWGAEN
jgi:hypothetical protein